MGEQRPNIVDMQMNSGRHQYSEKETDEMISKMENTTREKNSTKPMDARGMNFNKPLEENLLVQKEMEGESLAFETECHNCGNMGTTRMCTCEIPFFKELIVMSFTCEKCGARSTEVKTGGGISEKGKKITFYVEKPEDMDRDLFKSETAEISINELGLTITNGSLGGIYSTVEGLFAKMIETLRDKNPFVGDSADVDFKTRFENFINKLEKYQEGKEAFTLIIDDPLNNSWLSSPFHPEKDPKVEEVEYYRTEEQNIDFGIDAL